MKKDDCNCSGCRACECICPQKCIHIEDTGKRKFVRIKGSACKECGLCDSVCPHLHAEEVHEPMEGYNAWTKSRRMIKAVSSGGIASTMYQYGYAHHINCVGVNFDDDFHLSYVFLDSQKKMRKAIGSKYVYSNMNDVYEQITDKLRRKERVLFIGLPCHVAALRNYCKIREGHCSNLVCVDIVCHGVIMPTFFEKHVKYMKKKRCLHAKNDLLFRHKQNQLGLSTVCQGQIQSAVSPYDDAYMQMYLNGMYTQACLNCPYAQRNRVGDITIKDCCTQEALRKKWIPANQSSVLINTASGQEFWNKLESLVERYSHSVTAILGEDPMFQRPTPRTFRYVLFYIFEPLLGYRLTSQFLWGMSAVLQQIKKKGMI